MSTIQQKQSVLYNLRKNKQTGYDRTYQEDVDSSEDEDQKKKRQSVNQRNSAARKNVQQDIRNNMRTLQDDDDSNEDLSNEEDAFQEGVLGQDRFSNAELDDPQVKRFLDMLVDQKFAGGKAQGNSVNSQTSQNQANPTGQSKQITTKIYAQVPESKRTAIYYMLNLLCLILNCIIVIGVTIVLFVLLLQGKYDGNLLIVIHLIVPLFVLVLNFYILLLEDKHEFKFINRGSGPFLMQIAFIMSMLALVVTLFMKILSYKNESSSGSLENQQQYYGSDPSNETEITVLNIEEYLIHTVALGQSWTLREYAESRVQDVRDYKKNK
eukprot:403334616